MAKGRWKDIFKDLGNNVLGGVLGGVGATILKQPEVQKKSENEVGNLLGKYKGWIIGGLVLVVLMPLTIVLITSSKKR